MIMDHVPFVVLAARVSTVSVWQSKHRLASRSRTTASRALIARGVIEGSFRVIFPSGSTLACSSSGESLIGLLLCESCPVVGSWDVRAFQPNEYASRVPANVCLPCKTKPSNTMSYRASILAPTPTCRRIKSVCDASQSFSMEASVCLPCDVPQKWSGLEPWQ